MSTTKESILFIVLILLATAGAAVMYCKGYGDAVEKAQRRAITGKVEAAKGE